MMRVLLKNEWKIFLNSISTMRRNYLISYAIIFIVLGGFMFYLAKGIWSIGPSITDSILEDTLSYGFLMLLGFVFILGMPQVFKDMYSTKDLELLFTLPIQTRHIFWVKYLKSFLGIPLFAIILFTVPLFTYGLATGAGILFYPMVLFLLFLFTSIGLSLAYLFNLILVQIIPASRSNEFITMMSVLSGLLIYFVIMGPSLFSDQSMSDILLSGLPSLPDWVPTTWGSSVLVTIANGSINVTLPFVLLLLLGILSITFSTALTEKGFRTGWIRLSEGGRRKKKQRKHGQEYKVLHPIIAIGKTEWLSIKRDAREWLIAMPMVMVFIIGIISFISGDVELSELREFNNLSWPIAQAIMMFLFSLVGGPIAAASIGREGAHYWRLESLPITGREIALGKLWVNWLLPFVILTGAEVVIGVVLGWTFWQFILGIGIKGVLLTGWSTLGLWLGTIGAKYDPNNPQARLNFGVSLVLFISSLIYLVLVMIPFGYVLFPAGEFELHELPTDIEHGITGFWGMIATAGLKLIALKISHPVLMTCAGLFVIGLIGLGCGHFFNLFAERRIDRGITINVLSESSSKPLFGGKRKR